MVRLGKWSSLLFLLLTSVLSATEISDRYSPIPTFKDDRYTSSVNQNFQRLTYKFVADGGFNLIVRGSYTVIPLNIAMTNADYGIFVQTTFSSTVTVINKTTNNFKVQYSSPNNSVGGGLDWILVR